ncbi:MAG: sulfatase-like hydrolase/transferase [Chloroflexota bacterium]
MKKKQAAALAALSLLTVPFAIPSQTNITAQAQTAEKPNIVVIMTDDQDFDSLPVMRNLMGRPEGSWVNFTNAFVNHSVCCPSRATTLTGQYSHTHGAIGNPYCDQMDDTNTLPVWLDEAGYETALLGKYLNGYPWDQGDNYVPSGWDVFDGGNQISNEDWLSDRAVDFIDDTSSPFFLYLAYGHRTA